MIQTSRPSVNGSVGGVVAEFTWRRNNEQMWPIFLVLLLAIHLLLMQIASGGPIVAICYEIRGRNTATDSSIRAGKSLAKHSLLAFLGGILSGSLLGWLAYRFGHRDYSAAVHRFYPRIWWAAFELVFYLVTMLVYWLAWDRLANGKYSRWLHRGIAIAAATNLMYHFPPLLTLMADHVRLGQAGNEAITSAEFRSLSWSAPILAKSIHFALASLIVSAACGILPVRRVGQPIVLEPTSLIQRTAATMVAVGLAIELLVGMWLVVLASPAEQSAMMGGDLMTSGCLIGGVMGSLLALQLAAGIALGDVETSRHWKCSAAFGMVIIVVLAMSAVTARVGGLAT